MGILERVAKNPTLSTLFLGSLGIGVGLNIYGTYYFLTQSGSGPFSSKPPPPPPPPQPTPTSELDVVAPAEKKDYTNWREWRISPWRGDGEK
jgi:hypothetical protein